ncbi:hypothetical protein BDD12DRAFT_857959 [Trichophaea hybrida]|nr:hypothetical protein BDD12DRAFT_857959 [Trichophaea hybrida]
MLVTRHGGGFAALILCAYRCVLTIVYRPSWCLPLCCTSTSVYLLLYLYRSEDITGSNLKQYV